MESLKTPGLRRLAHIQNTDGQKTASFVNRADWSKHPLGTPDEWPLALKLTLSMLFNNRQPVCLFWGEEHWYFYNDGYLPILSEAKHPWAMGRPGAEVWAEVWPMLFPQIEQVRREGKATWNVDQLVPVLKGGKPSESYFTYSYSPVFDEAGLICGTLVTCTETTEMVKARQAESRLRAELQDREQYFRTLVDASPAILWTTDPDGMCTYLSTAWYEFTGHEAGTDLGLGWTDNIHPEDKEAAKNEFLRANAARTDFSMDYRLLDQTGNYRWVLDTGLARFDSDGKFLGMVGTVTDIHERRQLLERFERTAKASGLGVWYCDLPFSVLIWDKTVKAHFWLPPDAHVTIDTFYERIHPEDRERTRAAIAYSNEHAAPYDIQYRTTNPEEPSEYKWIRAIGWTDYAPDGSPIRFDGVTLDVTEQRWMEEALRGQTAALQEAVQARDEFLSIASHELKTPLTSLKLQTQLLSRQIAKGDPVAYSKSRVDRLAEQTTRQTARLIRLVDDMLDIGRIRSGKLSLSRESFDMCELARDVIAQMHSQFLEADCGDPVLTTCDPSLGLWDRMRIEQVLINLLTNAIRYGRGRPVEIRVERLESVTRFTVKDQGIGISKSAQTKIFDRFERAVDASEVSGLGLGLYISRQIVLAHGGEITVESEPGSGAIFRVELPH